MSYEEVTFARDCKAVQIPEGLTRIVPAGTVGTVMQVLGGHLTVSLSSGHLVRIHGEDADAVGREPSAFRDGTACAGESVEACEQAVWAQLRTCYDPEIPIDVVELGLIYGVQLSQAAGGGTRVDVMMTLTAPGCGMGQVLVHDIETKVRSIPGVDDVRVEMVFDPPWSMDMMSEAARLELGF